MRNWGQQIKKCRLKRGLKVYELANKVGVNPVYITQIERHGKLPSDDVAKRIDKALGINSFLSFFREKHKNLSDVLKQAMLLEHNKKQKKKPA